MDAQNWPALDWEQWRDTGETLHLFTQIVGKTRLALTPLQNHWWNVPLYVTRARAVDLRHAAAGRRSARYRVRLHCA